MTAQENADVLALQAFEWLFNDPKLRDAFLQETGARVSDFATLVKSRRFLAAVFDFVLSDDRWVLSFCADHGLKPEMMMRARSQLPGGDLPNWT